jgi:hypothetical protein
LKLNNYSHCTNSSLCRSILIFQPTSLSCLMLSGPILKPFKHSSSDLAGCRRLRQTFFCEGRSILKTNLVHNCLGSLFLGTATLIKANCKFRISDTLEKIFSLGNNTWLVYSVHTIATNQICPKTKITSPVTISSGQTVTVQPGCHIQTMDHIITAEDSDDFEI